MRKIILYIAQSLDGYIAKKDGGLEWLRNIEVEGEDYGYFDFYKNIDICIMGRKTYDSIKSHKPFPYKGKETYIITRGKFANRENLHFYGGPIFDLIEKLKKTEGKDIWLVGGGEIIYDFLNLDLIDEYIIATIPVLLGDGIPLFKKASRGELYLDYIDNRQFESGVVQMHYRKKS